MSHFSKFEIRNSKCSKAKGFTIVELLIVITIIIILAALIIGTVGYVQKKAARSRAEAEIAAIAAACESYKADNGTYPFSQNTTSLVPTNTDPTQYWTASVDLYVLLSGDTTKSGNTSGSTAKVYMAFKPNSLGRADMTAPASAGNQVVYIRDPFGNSYGYSTARNPDANPSGAATAAGYNPTFDLWSTGGATSAMPADVAQWVKNW